ncbi:MAG: hypothetical protein WA906_01900 [Pacificimonas sp.]
MIRHLFMALTILLIASPASAQQPKPLFDRETLLDLTLIAPRDRLAPNADRPTSPFGAEILTVAGDSLQVTMVPVDPGAMTSDCRTARWHLDVVGAPVSGTFAGQRQLTLVMPCSDDDRVDVADRAYTSFRLFEETTLDSVKARQVRIAFAEEADADPWRIATGFFIEPLQDVASRRRLQPVDPSRVQADDWNAEAAARYALFHYMIGSPDAALAGGLDDSSCCDEVKPLEPLSTVRSGLVPVPESFESSALSTSPDVRRAATVGDRRNRVRRYRGFCAHNPAAREEARKMAAKEVRYFDAIDDVPSLSPDFAVAAKRFLGASLADFEDEARFEREVLLNCRPG